MGKMKNDKWLRGMILGLIYTLTMIPISAAAQNAQNEGPPAYSLDQLYTLALKEAERIQLAKEELFLARLKLEQ